MIEVSVVIPTYNRSEKLKRAVKSVLNQTYPHFELIIVDDNSTDDTKEVVNEFQDHRIRYHRNEKNLGGGGSRNKGIELSRNEFIAFLDDDDEWLPTKLEKQITVLEKADPSYCGVYTGLVKIKNGIPISKKLNREEGDLFRKLLWENLIGSTSVVLLKKSCVKEVGGFTEGLPASQELDLFLKLSEKYKFKVVPEVLVKYFIHEDAQITSDHSKKLTSKKYLYKKYKEEIISDPKLNARHLYEVGYLEYLSGKNEKAFQLLKRAFFLSPTGIKHLIRKVLSKLILGI